MINVDLFERTSAQRAADASLVAAVPEIEAEFDEMHSQVGNVSALMRMVDSRDPAERKALLTMNERKQVLGNSLAAANLARMRLRADEARDRYIAASRAVTERRAMVAAERRALIDKALALAGASTPFRVTPAWADFQSGKSGGGLVRAPLASANPDLHRRITNGDIDALREAGIADGELAVLELRQRELARLEAEAETLAQSVRAHAEQLERVRKPAAALGIWSI